MRESIRRVGCRPCSRETKSRQLSDRLRVVQTACPLPCLWVRSRSPWLRVVWSSNTPPLGGCAEVISLIDEARPGSGLSHHTLSQHRTYRHVKPTSSAIYPSQESSAARLKSCGGTWFSWLNTALFRDGPLSHRATSIQVSVTALVAGADGPAVISGKRRDSDMFRKGRVSDKGVSPRPKAARTGKRVDIVAVTSALR